MGIWGNNLKISSISNSKTLIYKIWTDDSSVCVTYIALNVTFLISNVPFLLLFFGGWSKLWLVGALLLMLFPLESFLIASSFLRLKTSQSVLRNWLPVMEMMTRFRDALRTWRKWLRDINVEIQGGIWKCCEKQNKHRQLFMASRLA